MYCVRRVRVELSGSHLLGQEWGGVRVMLE